VNLHVVSGANGRIISVSVHGDTGPLPSGIANAGVVLEKGQQLNVLEVPAKFAERPLVELTDLLKVDSSGSRPKLVPVREAKPRKPTAKKARKG
jgi:hypothetical protein